MLAALAGNAAFAAAATRGPEPAGAEGAACNVSGPWTWADFARPNEFVVTSTSAERSLFEFSSANPTPWRSATGVVFPNRTVIVDYGCSAAACSETGCIYANCSAIQLGNGAFVRGARPSPPRPAQPAGFANELAFLAALSLEYLGGSRFYAKRPAPPPPSGPPRCDMPEGEAASDSDALFAPNVQPGGYSGEFARDYTYGLVGAPWPDAGPLGLRDFVWASEALFAAQTDTGCVPDVVQFIAPRGAASPTNDIAPGVCGNPSGVYCTFPAGSPLPRPKCCDTGDCATGSMDNVAFQVFNAVYLAGRIEAADGHAAAGAFVRKWAPSLAKGLAWLARKTQPGSGSSLPWNDPDQPLIGYGFEDTVVKTGQLSFASLLALEANAVLCNATRYFTADGAGAKALCARAAKISRQLAPALLDPASGMLRPATGLDGVRPRALIDVWGSSYASFLDGRDTSIGAGAWPADVPPPLSTPQRAAVGAYLIENEAAIFAAGQVRHLPTGQSWEQQWCSPVQANGSMVASPPCQSKNLTSPARWLYCLPGTYQNGGAWATPLHHVLPVLHRANKTFACQQVHSLVSNYFAQGADDLNEWVDASGKGSGARKYVASASNAHSGAAWMAAHGGCKTDDAKSLLKADDIIRLYPHRDDPLTNPAHLRVWTKPPSSWSSPKPYSARHRGPLSASVFETSTVDDAVPMKLDDEPAQPRSAAGSKPNVLIVFGDDIGYGDLGAFGHPTSRTPSLDRMAEQGMKLTMYESASSVCSPSRASLMTGRYYTRTGTWPNAFSPYSVGGLPLSEITIATALKTVGYTSGCLGKWHLGTAEFLPTNHGFDFYYGVPMTQNECTSNIKYPGSSTYIPVSAVNATDGFLHGYGPCPIFNGSTGAVTEQYDLLSPGQPQLYDMLGIDENYDAAAEGFVRAAVASSKPFFFYFASHHTHAPQFAPDSFLGYSRRGLHGDSLGLIDRSAGRLLNLTDELGIGNETLVVFSADNGGSLEWRELGGVSGDLRCGKGTTYEGGHRVPLIARWSGRIPAGSVVSELTSSLDWFPTILNLAGARIPADRAIDGVDMQAVLFGSGQSQRTEFLYFEFSTAEVAAVRIGPWKLHIFTHGSHCAAPFPDPNCYDNGFRNASYYAPGGGGPAGGCPTNGTGECIPMLVNLDSDPGETQLLTTLCANHTPSAASRCGQTIDLGCGLDPRCHSMEQLAPIHSALVDLHRRHTKETNPSLWAPSQVSRGTDATRFPCCNTGCTPRPFCCKCSPPGGDRHGGSAPAATTFVQRNASKVAGED